MYFFQNVLCQTLNLVHLEFLDCSWLDDASLTSEILPLLPADLRSFGVVGSRLTSTSLRSLTDRCPKLQTLRLSNCRELGPETLARIGTGCAALLSLAIQYDDEDSDWTTSADGDPLGELVRNFTSDLTSVSFVGFRSVSDIGVSYVAQCYFATVQKVNFSRCRLLTDASLFSLADECRLVRELSFNSTRVTDRGVDAVAVRLSRLKVVDLGNCGALTDGAVRSLAERCPNLERIDVENCHRLTDTSLVVLALRGANVKWIDMSGTGLTFVHPFVVGMKKLLHLRVDNCPDLIHPALEITRQGLVGIVNFYTDYASGHRLELMYNGTICKQI